jgi:hypothetical protein
MKVSKGEGKRKKRVLSHVSGGASEKNLGCTHDEMIGLLGEMIVL